VLYPFRADQIKTAAKIPAPRPTANLSALTAVGRAALWELDGAALLGALGADVAGVLDKEERLIGAVALLEGVELGDTLALERPLLNVVVDLMVEVPTEVVRETDVETETEGVDECDPEDFTDAEADADDDRAEKDSERWGGPSVGISVGREFAA